VLTRPLQVSVVDSYDGTRNVPFDSATLPIHNFPKIIDCPNFIPYREPDGIIPELGHYCV